MVAVRLPKVHEAYCLACVYFGVLFLCPHRAFSASDIDSYMLLEVRHLIYHQLQGQREHGQAARRGRETGQRPLIRITASRGCSVRGTCAMEPSQPYQNTSLETARPYIPIKVPKGREKEWETRWTRWTRWGKEDCLLTSHQPSSGTTRRAPSRSLHSQPSPAPRASCPPPRLPSSRPCPSSKPRLRAQISR